ncbi:MAG: hypothetical protein M1404_05560 [Acidobacteria bacterium]|nr:hypothetical protein [Acidobacteriota bacterium]
MAPTQKRLLYWAPRALGIAFALFISLFALDVFSMNLPLEKQLLAFAIHLVPTYLIVIVLIFAWKWEWLGGAGFIALGVLSMWRFRPPAYLITSGPAFLIGLLFLANWFMQRQSRSSA